MSLQARTVLNLIAGAVAGLLAWALTDLTGWFADILRAQHQLVPGEYDYGRFLFYGALFGLLLGLLLGIVEALSLDSQRQMWLALAWGGLIGFFGGALGLHLGQTMWALLAPENSMGAGGSPGLFFRVLLARALGYAIVGAVVGAAQGASRRSWVIARQGAFGGLLGGVLGGIVFQVTAVLLNTAVIARLAALVATGALVGFFVGLVQNLFKQAWIRVVLGRNEGKEYLLAKPVTTIGRSELSDIGLYGDPQIAPTHAVIETLPAEKRHRLRHVADAPGQGRGGPYPPTVVNGQPVTAEQWLADGDTIQIGRRTLLFQEKATRGAVPKIAPLAPNAGGARERPAAVPAPPGLGAGGPAPTRYIGQELSEAATVPPAHPQLGMGGASPEATVVMGRDGAGGLGTRLVGTAGPYAGQSFPLSHETLTLGRATDCGIALPADTLVSRRQAEISYTDGRHRLRDLGSSNGTWVNGQRLTGPHPLAVGDLIQIGDTVFRYD
ncbi:MAG: FHA domain-containing protein [Armatimonadetes bacterium]|nr:FHA domain-containing protein [Armatimonadota bacterium]